MYTIKVIPTDKTKPVIDRSVCSNNAAETIPIVLEICRSAYNMPNPIAICMDTNVYHIFDIDNQDDYIKVSILDNSN